MAINMDEMLATEPIEALEESEPYDGGHMTQKMRRLARGDDYKL